MITTCIMYIKKLLQAKDIASQLGSLAAAASAQPGNYDANDIDTDIPDELQEPDPIFVVEHEEVMSADTAKALKSVKQIVNTILPAAYQENPIIKDKIYGLYEKSEEFEERFVAVEVDINGIRTIVGESEGDEGTLINKISKIEQQSDKIGLSVEKVTKEFNSSVEVNKLREEVNSAFLKLNTDLGVSKSLTTEYFKDTKIDSAEKIKLESSISVLEKSKESLYISVNKIVDFLNEDDVESSVAQLNKGKNALNKAHENLVNIITLAISDNIITTSDRTLIINCFAQYNLKIQELKGTCDEIILLGTNGKIIEEIAKIGIKSDEIVLSVSETTNDLTNKLGQVKITADGIESTVNELREKQGVSVNLIHNTNLIDGLKGWSGLNSDIDIHNKKASNVKLPVRVHFIWLSKEGDCILIQADNGKNILIDCGEEATADSTISYLYNLGITKIDLFIATHSHSDHIGAAVKIIDNFGCKELLIREPDWNKMPEYEIGWKTKEYHEKLISKATGVGATIRRPSEGEVINVSDEISLKIFNTLTNDYTAYNYLSFSVLMSHHNNKYFFGGDMSIQSEGAVLGKLGKVDVLCVGHSGYDDTTSIDLLSEIKPDYSIILNPNKINSITISSYLININVKIALNINVPNLL